MAAPSTTIWPLEAHTRAKHEILHRYLQAWVAILVQGGFRRLLYIDGFAGPGRYSGGESGSPVLALRAALDQRIDLPTLLFLFVERDAARADVLQEVVDDLKLPGNFHVKVAGGQTFEAAFQDLVDFYRGRGQSFPPSFAFVDPFGWAGIPFSAIKEIMRHPNCEVLVTFMYEEINRFIGHPDQEDNFDVFFGTPRWRDGIGLVEPRARNRFLHDLYLDQLRSDADVAYVRSFEMRNDRDVTDYFLFYGTNSLLGLKKMKEAMWKVDESGEFSFSDATNPDQLTLFEKEPRFDLLRRQIVERFAGLETTVGEIEDFVLAETAFRETHYKRRVLRPIELGSPQLVAAVDPPHGRQPGTYPSRSLRLKFAAAK